MASFSRGCLVFPVPFVEEHAMHTPVYVLGTIVNHVAVNCMGLFLHPLVYSIGLHICSEPSVFVTAAL